MYHISIQCPDKTFSGWIIVPGF